MTEDTMLAGKLLFTRNSSVIFLGTFAESLSPTTLTVLLGFSSKTLTGALSTVSSLESILPLDWSCLPELPLVNNFSLLPISLEAGCGAWVGGTEASSLFRGVTVGVTTADTGLIGDKAGPGRAVVEPGAGNFELIAAWDPRGVGVDAEEVVEVRGVGVEGLLGVEERELGLVGSFALN